LFPEGTRTRTGTTAPFKPGLGRLIAGTNIPIVPCYLKGTFAALPVTRAVPRWKKISVQVGKPLSFAETSNDRAGWESIAAAVENAVRALATIA
jgi:1-acyl-sn-glycerol-3-phosphate acyltransferase